MIEDGVLDKPADIITAAHLLAMTLPYKEQTTVEEYQDALDWCNTNLGSSCIRDRDGSCYYDSNANWFVWRRRFYFRDHKNAILFKLRFSNAET